MPEDPRPQFGLRTVLLGVTGVAVVCSVVASCGLTGWRGMLMLLVILVSSVGAFVGLLICSFSGYASFDDLGWQVLKCLALGAIIVLSGHGLISLAATHLILLVMPMVIIVCIKLFWRDAGVAEIAIVGFSALWGAAIATGFAMQLAGRLTASGGL
jgi:hypothetical protein